MKDLARSLRHKLSISCFANLSLFRNFHDLDYIAIGRHQKASPLTQGSQSTPTSLQIELPQSRALSRKGDGVKRIHPHAHASSSPPAGLVSSHPRRRAGRRRPRPGSPWPSPAPGAWGLRLASVRWASGAIGPSHENRGGLACHLLRDASALAVGLPLHIIEAEDPIGELRRQVPVQYRGVQEDAPPRGLPQGLGNVARRIPIV